MPKKLLLVDYENIQKIDLSVLDDTFTAIVYVGAKQGLPKVAKKPATAHRFQRVDFHKIAGTGKNALDFHIAFQLGRTIETAPDTECYVLSRDKGFDPLLTYLNDCGLKCQRLVRVEDLISPSPAVVLPDSVTCQRCRRASTVDHYGGRWCTNCGCFASQPDPSLLPSSQPEFRKTHIGVQSLPHMERETFAECGWCNRQTNMSSGIYDDGEWMCGGCIARYAR